MITSLHLKTACLAYYRFKKQSLCATEVPIGKGIGDVVINFKGALIEVEIKTSISDLQHDKKKITKHEAYKNGFGIYMTVPNLYYLCVPTDLLENAKEFIKDINPNYGLLEFNIEKYNELKSYNRCWSNFIRVNKQAKHLKETITTNYSEPIISRLGSEVINLRIDLIKSLVNQ